MILLIDNYDSFSYNLYQMMGEIEPDIHVVRNDELSCKQIESLSPQKIVLSPGPGKPKDAGICNEVVRYFAGKLPILGVCLGHQAICEVYGAEVGFAVRPMHGKASIACIDTSCPLFAGLPPQIEVGRYHSLAVSAETIPAELIVSARTEQNEVMAVRHREHKIYGVQFHPESILTSCGAKILSNFLLI
jgi:anthranilate synthase component 2